MYETFILVAVVGAVNKWKWVEWVAIFSKNWCSLPAIKLHRVTSKNGDYIFEELSIYV